MDEAERQGFAFMRRLAAEWASGANRFNQAGECFLAAYDATRLVGVAGLNCDPYVPDEQVARLRHLYVLASARRLGIASQLVTSILHHARGRFSIVRLRTHTAEAAAFYVRLGFASVSQAAATHIMVLDRDKAARHSRAC